MAPAPLIIAMPHGPLLGGVTAFAVRLAGALAAAGRPVAVLLHPVPRGQPALEVEWHPAVEVVHAPDRLTEAPGDLSRAVPVYRDLVRRFAAQSGSPVTLAPQALGDCYGVAAALCVGEPELLRVVGWQHSDIEYDARVLAHYEPVIARFVGVSAAIAESLRQRLPRRARDVVEIPYGVDRHGPERSRPAAGAPVRLVYTGRLDHQQKRILALVHLSRELDRRAVPHSLTIVGDGPAAAELDRAARGLHSLRRVGGVSPGEVAARLERSDALVLPSRYEGLSVSMLEAMAAGCVPILARTRSGAAQAVEPGSNGEIAEIPPEAGDEETGAAMADAVVRFLARDRAAMARAARQTIVERFSLERHAGAVAALIDAAVREPPRAWPTDRPCGFSASGATHAGSGSVPPGGAARLRALLDRLAGRMVAIHGAGQHTLQLAPILAGSPTRIVAIADDDRERHGHRLLGWTIIAPDQATASGATDVVISSWMHEEAIWERRAIYERQGLRVHRIYPRSAGSP